MGEYRGKDWQVGKGHNKVIIKVLTQNYFFRIRFFAPKWPSPLKKI